MCSSDLILRPSRMAISPRTTALLMALAALILLFAAPAPGQALPYERPVQVRPRSRRA